MGEGSILKLAEALDSYIPQPQRLIDGPFLMPVEDVFRSVAGTVVTGGGAGDREGGGRPGDCGFEADVGRRVCTGWRCSASCFDQGRLGTMLGAAAGRSGRSRARAGAGQAGDITPHTKFTCEVYILSKEEGAAHAVFPGYRPQFIFGRRM